MISKDRLYMSPNEEASDFVFDERVAQVFPDMIRRSVPGYGLVVAMAGVLARRYAQSNSALYDLGCSLGAVSLTMSRAVRAKNTRITAVDNSPAMINSLQRSLARNAENRGNVPIDTVCADVVDVQIENASVVVLNFTLQFIAPDARLPLLCKVAQGLLPGGMLLLSEKIRFDSPQEQELQTDWHHDFKRAQGYSELEIARKRDALENVLLPDTLSQHRERLRQAGFSDVYPWFQALNFASFIAFK